jgi:murein L,D-transpeptidase YafK
MKKHPNFFWQHQLMLLLALAALTAFAPPRTAKPKAGEYYLVVEKYANTITLFDQSDWIVQWPCTFGSNDLGDKMYQGDRRTPEGSFTIARKYSHAKWHKMLMLDYPTPADRQKFEERKLRGQISANAKIGGSIGIHGTWPREEWAVENLQNWTQGCISMRNDHIDELYSMVSEGTVVIVKR